MSQCQKCKAIINSKWAECIACGCPIDESDCSQNERAAIQAEGGPSFPVAMVLEGSILGAAVDVLLWPDRATVAGVEYSNDELKNLISRGLPAADLQTIHEVKKSFNGEVKK